MVISSAELAEARRFTTSLATLDDAQLGRLVVQPPNCQHRWLLEPPVKESSHGTCSGCGAEREFSNRASLAWSETHGAVAFGVFGRQADDTEITRLVADVVVEGEEE